MAAAVAFDVVGVDVSLLWWGGWVHSECVSNDDNRQLTLLSRFVVNFPRKLNVVLHPEHNKPKSFFAVVSGRHQSSRSPVWGAEPQRECDELRKAAGRNEQPSARWERPPRLRG